MHTLSLHDALPISVDHVLRSEDDAAQDGLVFHQPDVAVDIGNLRKAIEIGATRIINIKPGRVGGHTVAKRVHDVCAEHAIPVWCGGMLEFGIGRAHNVHLASLPSFSLPGDVSASERYFETEIIGEPFTVESDGTMKVPTGPGIGVTVLEDAIRKLALQTKEYRPAR